jgi:hypothetical protein
MLAHTQENPFVTNLIAGQSIDAGDILVWNDAENLYIKYEGHDGWQLTETNVAVEVTLDDIPATGSGNPKIGKFEWAMQFDPPVESYAFEIPLDGWVTGTSLFVMAHAVVVKEGIDGWQEETAWGCGEDFGSRRWACYFEYEVQDEPGGGKPILNIPSETIQATFKYHLADTGFFDSYFDVQLAGVDETADPPYAVNNVDWYDGWCADSYIEIATNTVLDVNLYLSTDYDGLPSYAKDDEQWEYVNFILNQDYAAMYGANWRTLQNAIWYFTDSSPVYDEPGFNGYDPAVKDQIVAHALANGAGFYPGEGQWMAIIVDPNVSGQQTAQVGFIVVDP